MRHMRNALGVMTVVCVFAIPASSALAGEFEATRSPNACSVLEPCLTEGKGIEEVDPEHPEYTQAFKFGAFKVLCKIGRPFAKTAEQGAPTWTTSESFTTQIKFGKCLTEAKFGPKFEGGIKTYVNGGAAMTFTYLPNAQGAKVGELGQVEISRGSVKIGAQICTMGWGGQTILSRENHPAATFEPVLAVHESLVFHNEFRGIEWEYEGGQCVGERGFEEEAKTTEGNKATFTGSFIDNLKKGNLTYKP
jgi:hypothetical protein